jgi:hypothetical protein
MLVQRVYNIMTGHENNKNAHRVLQFATKWHPSETLARYLLISRQLFSLDLGWMQIMLSMP